MAQPPSAAADSKVAITPRGLRCITTATTPETTATSGTTKDSGELPATAGTAAYSSHPTTVAPIAATSTAIAATSVDLPLPITTSAIAITIAAANHSGGLIGSASSTTPSTETGLPSKVMSTPHVCTTSPGLMPGLRSGDIQWTRWSCHANSCPLPTSFHSGGPFGLRLSGMVTFAYRSRIWYVYGDCWFSSTTPSARMRRNGSPWPSVAYAKTTTS